jgi:predicted nucleic acid-binding protein
MPVIVLDTNVISELMRPQPDQRVLAWANSLDPQGAAITAMNEAEILHGLARLPDGRRKQALRESWDALATELFAGRVWAFTSEAAHWYGELVSHRERLARPIATADAVIAAIALVHSAPLATRNTSDFADLGLQLIDPWTLQ